MAKTFDGDERVLATAQQIVKSLGTSKNVKEDMIFILSNLGNRFADINDLLSSSNSGKTAFQERLDSAEEIIFSWESGSSSYSNASKTQSFLFSDECVDESVAYLAAVDDVLKLTEELPSNGEVGEITDRAENLLQVAMARLEDEFKHVMVRNTAPLDAGAIYGSMRRFSYSFASDSAESVEFDSEDRLVVANEEERESVRLSFNNISIDLINPIGVEDLKDIAERMIKAGYEKECCQVYTSVRREVLDEYCQVLGVEKLGIEEVQKIDWASLDGKMKKWSQAVKVVIRVLLAAERRLCDQVFSESDLIKGVCFGEIAKGCVMQLMTFAEAVTIGKRSSEKLFRVLDMYDALADVLVDLHDLVSDDSGEFLCGEVQGILDGLGEAAKGTFEEFVNAVKGETSRKTVQGGDIHPLSRYVMNYVKLLVDYSATLNLLLENDAGIINGPNADNDDDAARLGDGSPLAQRLLVLLSLLESNLEDKSTLYEDKAMKYVFLMNNIHYIVQKVKGSDLGKFLGDQWVRKHRGQIRQYATSYLRVCWSKVLGCLKDEGTGSSSNSSNFKVALKEKLKNFNLCFEEVHKNQSTWRVPDPQLRDELRISISEKVIPAYRAFMGRSRAHVEAGKNAGKYIRYTPDDLENYISDLFEGGTGVVPQPRRKISG